MGIVSAMMQVGAAIKHAVVALFKVTHSLRFDGSGDYLEWTPTVARGSNWTFSVWFKRAATGTGGLWHPILEADNGASSDTIGVYDDELYIGWRSGQASATINDSFADTEWHHLVVTYTSGQSTLADTLKIYLDGTPKTISGYLFTRLLTTSDTLNFGTNVQNYIGGRTSGTSYWFNGQLAEIHFIDGTAYDETYFGETRGGQWVPKEVTGVTYGNNGFYLDFADSSTASALGTDASTNTNNFTVNGGITPDDQLLDTPNLRFATLDPANSNADVTFAEGNLRYSTTATSSDRVVGHTLVIPENGKVYLEVMGGVVSATNRYLGPIGFNTSIPSAGTVLGNTTGWEAYTNSSSVVIRHNTQNNVCTNPAFSSNNYANNVYMLALDRSGDGAFYFGVNGQWVDSISGGTLTSSFGSAGNLRTQLSTVSNIPATGTLYMASGAYKNANDNYSGHLNFGQDHTFSGLKSPLASPHSDDDGNGEFRYQPPAGFKALATSY